MSSIYKNQSYLTIYLDTNETLTTATNLKILYQKPDGSTGEWSGTADDTTKIKYTVLDDDLDQAGQWYFQSYFELNNKKAYGEKTYYMFDKNLD